MLAAAAYAFDNPLILEWHNAAAVFQDPALAHIGLVLLTHQLGYFDILPLYVVLMLAAPADRADRQVRPAAAACRCRWRSISPSLIVPFTAPTWPVPGQWFFNPFTWQAIFVLGFALSRDEGLGAIVRRNMRPIRIVALPIVLVTAVVVWFNLVSGPDHSCRSRSSCSSTERAS